MGRALLALILITNLLVCPFRCLSNHFEQADVEECAVVPCCCCESPNGNEPSDSDGEERSPDNDCSCPNCICEGATIHVGADVVLVDARASSGIPLVPAVEWLVLRANRHSFFRTEGPPRFPRARDALSAFQVWLI